MSTYWSDTLTLLGVGFVQHALIAAALLGVLSGVVAPLVVLRRMSFSVHATSELALMGAAAALLFSFNIGVGAVLGAVAAAVAIGLIGLKQTDSTVGVVLSFGLGLSVLFISLYPGNSSSALSLLTGQIVGVRAHSLWTLAAVTLGVCLVLLLFWRPLLFASVDPVVAATHGVPVRWLSLLFAVLTGLAASQAVQIVGALLVVALLITPGAAAVQVARSPGAAIAWSFLFAEVSAVGGIVLSLAPGLPVSVVVVTISTVIYVVCRIIGRRQRAVTRRDEDRMSAL